MIYYASNGFRRRFAVGLIEVRDFAVKSALLLPLPRSIDRGLTDRNRLRSPNPTKLQLFGRRWMIYQQIDRDSPMVSVDFDRQFSF